MGNTQSSRQQAPMHTAINSAEAGFTLVEIMITLLIASFLMAAVLISYQAQQKTYLVQEQVTEMQQNLRAAMDTILAEVRLAGYDPTCEAKASITNAQAGRLTITIDRDGDGKKTFPGEETVAYGFTNANDADNDGIVDDLNGDGVRDEVANLARRAGAGVYQPVSENIARIEFCYTLENGTRSTAPAAGLNKDIRTIEVSILARAEREDFQLGGSRTYTTACGNNWGPFTDRYRRRLLISSVQCRNMGLCE